ncbi:MAG TPA: molybdopterin cofactor-binding domain-containing protein [Gemmatimonadaceae bacterium]|jgi:isoquinoline 1-oxidoreductase
MTTRREFLERFGAGLVVTLVSRDLFAATTSHPSAGISNQGEQIGAWLHVAGDGRVTVYTGKVEFGQGIRTSLAQEVAEELRVPMSSIQMVMGDTELTPFDMGTFGSLSTPQMGTKLRKVSAAARDLLIGLAAQQWRVTPTSLTAADGRVHDPKSGRTVAYGDLTKGRRLVESVRDDAELTDPTRWRVAGTSVPNVEGRELVTGRHSYTSDIVRPGMLVGKVVRPIAYGSKLAEFDSGPAAKFRGVVVTRDGDFAGVVAPDNDTATRALAAVRAVWTPPNGPLPDSRDIYAYLKSTRPKESGERGGEGGRGGPIVKGDVDAALAAAAKRLTRSYTVAYIAHVPLEPRAAVAEWSHDQQGDKLTVWTGTQRPFAVRDELAEAFSLSQERVRVIVPDTGSGYGGKHTGECAVEAARLARAARKPVKLVWTREEEFRWAYFRPAGVIDVDAGVHNDGTLVAWSFDNYNSGPAAIAPWYEIPNQRVTYHPSDTPLRQGSYRGLAATANHFARETHINELAAILTMDALAFRLKNIQDARLRDVFTAAGERFGWGKKAPTGHGYGMGGGFEKGGYFATFAEIAVEPRDGVREPRVVRAVTAFDNGPTINPDGLRNQIVGAMIQGIGGALFEAIDFDHGAVRNAHLAQYRVPRFSDVPKIEVVLMNRKDKPAMGAGEAPIMGMAPAIGAAIYDATGIRPRSMPMARAGLQAEVEAQPSR